MVRLGAYNQENTRLVSMAGLDQHGPLIRRSCSDAMCCNPNMQYATGNHTCPLDLPVQGSRFVGAALQFNLHCDVVDCETFHQTVLNGRDDRIVVGISSYPGMQGQK